MTLITTARWALFLGIALAVLLFLPFGWWPLMTGKLAIAGVLILVSGVAAAVALARREIELPVAALIGALLPIVYLVSYLLSSDRAAGLIGSGIDADALLFIVLCFLALLISSMLVQGGARARDMLVWTGGALALAGLFQIAVLTVGLGSAFSDRSVNLIGKWNDFALGMGLLLSFVLIELEWGTLRHGRRIAMWVLGAVLLVLLGLVNFTTAWGILLAGAVVVAAVAWVGQRKTPWASLIAALVAVIFIFFGAALSGTLAKVLPASSLEVRPSLQTTLSVISASHGSSVKDAALGTGPNTFGNAWLMHKPQDVNQSAFWNLDFAVGFSTLLTAFGSVGLLGALAWLLIPVFVLWGMWRSRRTLEPAGWGIGFSATILWAAIVFYVPSSDLILLAFALSGAALGVCYRAHVRSRFAFILAIALAVLALGSGIIGARRLTMQIVAGQATDKANAGDFKGASALAVRASQIDMTPDVMRLRADIAAAYAAQLAQATSTAQQADLTAALNESAQAGQAAIALDPQDYRSFLSVARLDEFLATNKVQGAFDAAKGYYEAAAALSPYNPSIPLSLARLEASAGTSTQALQGYLSRALTLKPDYTDAILFVVQLDIAQNDLPSATRDATTAVRTAPGVPSLWFELGLLYYAQNDTKNAIPNFEQALALQPGYANAQYFLGLSYAAQNRPEDAMALFKQLSQSNPENSEVQSILSNLQAGKAPLGTSTPPVERPNAPIQ